MYFFNKINLGNDKGEKRYARIPFKYWKSSCICMILWNCVTLLGSNLGYVLLRYSILFIPELNALGPLYSSIWSLILYSPSEILFLDCSGRLIAKKMNPILHPFQYSHLLNYDFYSSTIESWNLFSYPLIPGCSLSCIYEICISQKNEVEMTCCQDLLSHKRAYIFLLSLLLLSYCCENGFELSWQQIKNWCRNKSEKFS